MLGIGVEEPMKTREQFGNYLLLKKLSEDPFGETFRAGRFGRGGLERVVLLRVFNGPGIDGQAFAQRLGARKAVHEALRSPNIGEGVDLGSVHGIPYVAWDYVSGKNLAEFFHQATRTGTPIPSDHALLVTERIALALAVGYETRVEDKRLAHGCVVPELVLLSNEGETRLLGFEAAPLLRQLAVSGPAANHFAPYLSPEARAGQPLGKSDDVFSLGVILYELLTAERLAVAPSYEAAIGAARLGIDDSPLSDELKTLLANTLCTVDRRIGDAVTWHKTLSKAMFEGQYNPTTFNLAFFMHNLFREDIERETHEIEAEKSISMPAPAPAPVPATAAHEHTGSGAVREDTLAVRERYGLEESKKSGMSPAVLGGLVAALLVAGVGGWFLFGRSEPPPPAVVTEPAPVQPAAPAGPTPEEIQAQIEMLVAEQTKALEKGLQEQQATTIKALEEQLKQAQEAQRQAAERAAAQAAAAAAQPSEPPTKAAAAEPTKAEPTTTVAETKAPPAETKAPPASRPAEPETKAPAVAETTKAPTTTPPTARPATSTAAPAPTYRTGDLVAAGSPGVSRPKLMRSPSSRFPEMARRMNQRQATVRVRVLVDETGKVIDSQLVGREVGYGFDREALRAAQSAEFEPARTESGVRVKMWFDFAIEFKS